MSKGDPVTYKELTPEHKEKFDEIKALFEADLIRSFERTCHHGIRWKGFSPEGSLDGVDLSISSEERLEPYTEMPGLDRSIVEHRLPLKKGFWPFQQRARQMRTEVLEEVKKEIEKMLEVEFIRPYRRRMAGDESAWILGTSIGPHQRMNTRCPLQKC
jgi:hypothetical protein